VDVTAGFNSFATVESIPYKMSEMIKQHQSDIHQATKSGFIDPIMLAAKYAHIFVNTHPFLDGNGRMCRMILNSILLKFGSFFVCLGEDGPARETYLDVASAASQLEATYDSREEEEKPVMHKELASLVLSCVKASLGELLKAVAK
jgi:Fic family protein